MDSENCWNCGKPLVKGANFCKFCGSPIRKTPMGRPAFSEPLLSEEPKYVPAVSKSVEPSPVEEEIPEEIEMILMNRALLKTFEKKKREILDKIDDVSERVKVGLMPAEEAKKKIEDLKEQVVKLNLERKKAEEGETTLPVEAMIAEINDLREKISKLEDIHKKGKTSEKTYEKVKEEFEEKLQDLEEKYAKEKMQLDIWITKLKTKEQTLKEELETLYVKKEIGEVQEEEYKEKLNEITDEIEKTQSMLQELKSIISKI
ncbi:MAG: zinc-ribbon domain-containing protein [Candidatus Hodarchaeota archaeon]